ncbi:flippase [uncultured Selenomonas sp.]|uniref:flippase n=1 Tax=uncultured Selenomonas sp. TaxID=159275 RepID=UPI0025F4F886|nr:flippase [uncultured Selenomonas sp.]
MKRKLSINRQLSANIVSLFILKGAEYIVSFITLPYLLRVLGPAGYGSIVFCQTIMNYGNLVVDYGFNLTAPRDIAKDDPEDIPQDFAAILGAKLLLLALATIVLGAGLFVFRDSLDTLLVLACLPALVGGALFPIWYFQGIQQMRFITIFNIIARTCSVIGIFLCVQETTDVYAAALFLSVTPLVAGLLSLAMIARSQPRFFRRPTLAAIRAKFRDGWDIFLSTLFINLYTNSNVFILGLLTNETCVGYYAAASKLIEAVKGLLMPISNAIFPHVSAMVRDAREGAIQFLRKATRVIGGLSLILSALVCLFAEPVTRLIMGDAYDASIRVLRIISFLPFIIGLSNIFGIQTMVAFGMQRLFSRILMASAAVNFLLVFPLVLLWQEIGMAITVTCVECFVTITMYIALRRHGIRLM